MSPNLIRDTVEKVDLIWKCLLMAQSQQKSYANKWRRPLEFEVGDHVFIKVMPKRGSTSRGSYHRDTSDPSRYSRGCAQLRIFWHYCQVYWVSTRYFMSLCSGSTLQIQLM